MGVVPILHPDGGVRTALRRGLRPFRIRMAACRSVGRLERLVLEDLVLAVVLDIRGGLADLAFELIAHYPRIPVFACSAFRPDDGRLLVACAAAGVRGILVDGLDDPVAGEVVAKRSAAAERRALLADAPARLRLTEPIQVRAWEEILLRVDEALRTSDVAAALGISREHLSREFQAGGAPTLKRIIDLAKTACGAHLLTNPGYRVTDVARILRFASPSHLAICVRRVGGVTPSELPSLGVRGVLNRFLEGRTRAVGGRS